MPPEDVIDDLVALAHQMPDALAAGRVHLARAQPWPCGADGRPRMAAGNRLL
jgi:hypothetical protein